MLKLERGTMELKNFWQEVGGARKRGQILQIVCWGNKARDLPADIRMLLHRANTDTRVVVPADFGELTIPIDEILGVADKVQGVSVPLYTLALEYQFLVETNRVVTITGRPLVNKG